MPYIIQDQRKFLEKPLSRLTEIVNNLPLTAGELNYIITKLVHAWIGGHGYCYDSFNSAIGILECVKQELYRRKISPYEDIKIKENGDV